MSNRQKLWLTIALFLFVAAHIGGAFMLGSHAQEHPTTTLVSYGD
jgi:hypothetical protein